jgi:acyl dehydratase
MPVDSDIVGRALPEETLLVTTRMALAYAAAIDERARPCNDDLADDFMAPPSFCVSLEWRWTLMSRKQGRGLVPEELSRFVHMGQNTQFLSPIRPGMRVRVTGRTVEVRQTKAGALVRTQLEISDTATGAPLTRTLIASLARGVAVCGPDRSLPDIADITENWSPPAERERTRLHLDRWFAHRYTECTRIWNPIHTERAFARSAGLAEPIVHGTALWALVGREIVARYAPGAPERLTVLAGRFAAMVLPNSQIVIEHGRLENDGDIAFVLRNEVGDNAIVQGFARCSVGKSDPSQQAA